MTAMALGDREEARGAFGVVRVLAVRFGEASFAGLEASQFRCATRDKVSRAPVFPFYVQSGLRQVLDFERLRTACQRKKTVDITTDRI